MGKDSNAHVGVSDDYGAYRNLFMRHQLCWSHPLRKFRDLRDSPSLPRDTVKYTKRTYEAFAKLYGSLQKILAEENEHYENTKEWRALLIARKQEKLEKAFHCLSIIHSKDPQKLKTLKMSLQKNQRAYFTCLS
jgi:hypothetical protein